MPARKRGRRPYTIQDRVEVVVYMTKHERRQLQRSARAAALSTSSFVRQHLGDLIRPARPRRVPRIDTTP